MVAFVKSFILFSVSSVPSQWAEIKPPLLSKVFLKSSKLSTSVMLLSLKFLALSKRFFWISSSNFDTKSKDSSIFINCFSSVSLLNISIDFFSRSFGPIVILTGTPWISCWANFSPGLFVSRLSNLELIPLSSNWFLKSSTTWVIEFNCSSFL